MKIQWAHRLQLWFPEAKQQKDHPYQVGCCKLSYTCIKHDIVYARDTHVPILPGRLSSSPVFSGVRVARSLVFWVMFCRSLFFGHCVVWRSIDASDCPFGVFKLLLRLVVGISWEFNSCFISIMSLSGHLYNIIMSHANYNSIIQYYASRFYISLRHKYMTAQFSGMVQALQ